MQGSSAHSGSGVLAAGDVVYLDRTDTWLVSSATTGGLVVVGGVHYVGNVYDPEGAGTGRAILRANGRCEAGGIRITQDDTTYATWVEGIEVDGNGNRGSGIGINHPFWSTGMTDAMKRIQNCYVHGWTGNGGEGDYMYGIIVSDNSSDQSGMVSNVEILDNVTTSAPRDNICLYPGDNGRVTNVLVRGNIVSGIKTDPSYGEGHGIMTKGDVRNSIVEYNYVTGVNSSALFMNGPESGANQGPTGVIYRHNILATDDNNGTIRYFGTGTKSGDVYGNIVYGNSSSGGFNMSGNSGTMDVDVYNNTFACFVDIGNPTSTGTLNFRNNLISAGNATPLTDSGTDIDTHSNNLYNRSTGTTLVTSGGSSFTSGNLSSYEATGIATDAQLVNASNLPTGFTGTYPSLTPNTTGLNVLPGSPAINAGADLGSSFATSINSLARTGTWDIGAYESIQDTTPPTPTPMTFATVPAAVDAFSVTMTATSATDAISGSDVEYFFDETSGAAGGSDSGWQDSATYTDSGLTASTLYTYRVKARDASLNETAYSSASSATTSAPPPTGKVNASVINVGNLRVTGQ